MSACAAARLRFWKVHVALALVVLALPALCWCFKASHSDDIASMHLTGQPMGTLPFGIDTMPQVTATTLVVATFIYSFYDAHSSWVSPLPLQLQPAACTHEGFGRGPSPPAEQAQASERQYSLICAWS